MAPDHLSTAPHAGSLIVLLTLLRTDPRQVGWVTQSHSPSIGQDAMWCMRTGFWGLRSQCARRACRPSQ